MNALPLSDCKYWITLCQVYIVPAQQTENKATVRFNFCQAEKKPKDQECRVDPLNAHFIVLVNGVHGPGKQLFVARLRQIRN